MSGLSAASWPRWYARCQQIVGKPLFVAQNEEGQLTAIFSVLGLPTKDEWPELETLPEWNNFNLKFDRNDEDFDYLLNKADSDALELIMRMLACNPEHRISAQEALLSPWFQL